MTEKLFIPKTILQGIAEAIRSKTKSTAPIKVKNMAKEINLIPTGGLIIDTNMDGEVQTFTDQESVYCKLTSLVQEKNVQMNGLLVNAPVLLYGIAVDTGEKWLLELGLTKTDGTYDFLVDNTEIYKKYLLEFNTNYEFEKFKPNHLELESPAVHFQVWTGSSGSISIQPIQGDNLITYIIRNNRVYHVTNKKGDIEEDGLDADSIVDVYYKGLITDIIGNRWNDIKSVVVPPKCSLNADLSNNNDIESIIFSNPSNVTYTSMSCNNCSNLRYVQFTSSLSDIRGNIFLNCSLDYINIPANALNFRDVLNECNLTTLEIESGYERMIDAEDLNLNNSKSNLMQIIGIGQQNPSDISSIYDTHWLRYLNLDHGLTLSFQPDTYRITNGASGECSFLDYIHIPVSCKAIEEDSFIQFQHTNNVEKVLIRFDSPTPPKFASDDSFHSCFNDNYEYNILVPSYEAYNQAFEGYSQIHIVNYDDPETRSESEIFHIEWFGKNFKSYIDEGLFGGCDEARYILDDKLQPETEEPQIFTNQGINLTSTINTLHSFTVFTGFNSVISEAFLSNKEIRGFYFPKSLNHVENKAFMGCSNLKTLVFYGECPEIDDDAFTGLSNDCRIFVPAEYVENYKSTELNRYNIISY